MEFNIKNRKFGFGRVSMSMPDQFGYNVLNFILLEFWLCWSVKSFEVVLCNLSFRTWNTLNKIPSEEE
jgi:hypothetical protein